MRFISLILLIVLLAGCGSSDEKIESADKTTASWSTAVRVAAEDYQQHQVPRRYLNEVLTAAEEELPSTREQLKKTPPDKRSTAEQRLDLLDARVRAMQAALSSKADDAFERVASIASTMPVDAEQAKRESAGRFHKAAGAP